jgi:hypothetical protein
MWHGWILVFLFLSRIRNQLKNSKHSLERDFHFGRLNPRNDYTMHEQFKKYEGKREFLNAQNCKWRFMLPVGKNETSCTFQFLDDLALLFYYFKDKNSRMHATEITLTSLINFTSLLGMFFNINFFRSGQISWLQIQRSGFDSRHYQIF